MYCTLCEDIGAENLLKGVETPNLEAYVNSLPPYPQPNGSFLWPIIIEIQSDHYLVSWKQ